MMKMALAYAIAASILAFPLLVGAGVVAISNTQGGTMVLTSEDCAKYPGWGLARAADNAGVAQSHGCWQLLDNGAIVVRLTPQWKEVFWSVGDFRWLPNIRHARNQ